MADPQFVEQIAGKLGALVHPGDDTHEPTPISMPMFRNTSLPPEMAEEFAREAGMPTSDTNKLFTEALFAEIEQTHQRIPNDEAERLRRVDADDDTPLARNVRLKCTAPTCPGYVGAYINFADPDNPRVNLQNLIQVLSTLSPECPHKPIGAAS